jgi:ribosomal protein L13
MKQYTDFNDLATKSVLGPKAVKSQVRSAIESLLERGQALGRQAQKRLRVQRQENQLRHTPC